MYIQTQTHRHRHTNIYIWLRQRRSGLHSRRGLLYVLAWNRVVHNGDQAALLARKLKWLIVPEVLRVHARAGACGARSEDGLNANKCSGRVCWCWCVVVACL